MTTTLERAPARAHHGAATPRSFTLLIATLWAAAALAIAFLIAQTVTGFLALGLVAVAAGASLWVPLLTRVRRTILARRVRVAWGSVALGLVGVGLHAWLWQAQAAPADPVALPGATDPAWLTTLALFLLTPVLALVPALAAAFMAVLAARRLPVAR